MTDSLPEVPENPTPFQVLANIRAILEKDPENGLATVREAFTAEFERAQKEIAEKTADFEELKRVRLDFTGDKAGFTLANKQMRDLRKEHKAEVGKLMGQARGRLTKALEARNAELEEERRSHSG